MEDHNKEKDLSAGVADYREVESGSSLTFEVPSDEVDEEEGGEDHGQKTGDKEYPSQETPLVDNP